MLASWVLPGWMSDTQEQLKETLGMVVVVVGFCLFFFFFFFFFVLFFFLSVLFWHSIEETCGRRRRKVCVCLGEEEEWAVKVQKRGHGRVCVCVCVCVCVGVGVVNRLHTEMAFCYNWSRLDRAYSTNQKPGKKSTENEKKEQKNSDMTNAVYSCWCFDGARVGEGRRVVLGKKKEERGPIICLR